jgi:inosine-uridine nucleoside N-ribohydrolase
MSGRRAVNLKNRRLAFPVILLVTFGATPPVEGDERAPKPRRVILDTDPGIDDAMAILFALRSPALEVLGITTVFGNADVEVVAKVPSPDFVHGADGLGNISAPPPAGKAIEMSAAEFTWRRRASTPGK